MGAAMRHHSHAALLVITLALVLVCEAKDARGNARGDRRGGKDDKTSEKRQKKREKYVQTGDQIRAERAELREKDEEKRQELAKNNTAFAGAMEGMQKHHAINMQKREEGEAGTMVKPGIPAKLKRKGKQSEEDERGELAEKKLEEQKAQIRAELENDGFSADIDNIMQDFDPAAVEKETKANKADREGKAAREVDRKKKEKKGQERAQKVAKYGEASQLLDGSKFTLMTLPFMEVMDGRLAEIKLKPSTAVSMRKLMRITRVIDPGTNTAKISEEEFFNWFCMVAGILCVMLLTFVVCFLLPLSARFGVCSTLLASYSMGFLAGLVVLCSIPMSMGLLGHGETSRMSSGTTRRAL